MSPAAVPRTRPARLEPGLAPTACALRFTHDHGPGRAGPRHATCLSDFRRPFPATLRTILPKQGA